MKKSILNDINFEDAKTNYNSKKAYTINSPLILIKYARLVVL